MRRFSKKNMTGQVFCPPGTGQSGSREEKEGTKTGRKDCASRPVFSLLGAVESDDFNGNTAREESVTHRGLSPAR